MCVKLTSLIVLNDDWLFFGADRLLIVIDDNRLIEFNDYRLVVFDDDRFIVFVGDCLVIVDEASAARDRPQVDRRTGFVGSLYSKLLLESYLHAKIYIDCIDRIPQKKRLF